MDDGQAQPIGERLAAADLHGEPVMRPMQHRLAMKSHHIDAVGADTMRGEKARDCGGMAFGHHLLGSRQRSRARFPVVQRFRIDKRATQEVALFRAIGVRRARPEAGYALAIGLDHSHVDAVERSAAHKADRTHHPSPGCIGPWT